MKKRMDGFAKFITRRKLLILSLALLITVLSLIAFTFVHVNSNIFDYLPDDMTMSQGLDYIKTAFGMEGDAIVGISGITYSQLKDKIADIEELEGINKGGVLWLGSMYEMKNLNIGEMLGEYSSGYVSTLIESMLNEYGYSMQRGKVENGVEYKCIEDVDISAMVDDMLNKEDVSKLFFPQNDVSIKDAVEQDIAGNYVLVIQLGVPSASDEAMSALKSIDKIFADYDSSIGGSSKIIADLFDSTINEMWKYIIIAVLVMFVILLLTTDNLVEPFILMVTLGIAVLVNMGTNIIFGSVSVITFSAASVLQLGLSMDYAIFLIHSFKEERSRTLTDEQAMRIAIPKAFSTITASSLTTVGGSLALLFMRFEIGKDLGFVLAKGVFLSLITIIVVLPCLILMTRKWQEKTTHALVVPKLHGVASFSIKHRKLFAIIFAVLLIPVMILQSKVELNYMKFSESNSQPSQIDSIVESMSNAVIVALPVSYADKELQKDNLANNVLRDKNLQFIEEVKNESTDNVMGVLGIYSIVPEEHYSLMEFLCSLMDNKLIASQLPPEAATLKGLAGDNHALYFIMVEDEAESELTAQTLANIKTSIEKQFGDDYYLTGMAQAKQDLAEITPRDFNVITIVSVLIIFVILLLTIKSFKMSLLIILVIEFGIFINLAINAIIGAPINFMGYIIISSIQLGATVDYAILFSVKYKNYITFMPAKEAAYRSLSECSLSVLTSVSIMAGCCLSVGMVTANLIAREITLLIARGSVISGLLVLFVLPSVMILATGRVAKLTRVGKKAAKVFKKGLKKSKEESSQASD
ncbi:MAG: MMPL family transporter [Clostridia bacterium]|nr:MMPL family transporter [Clostridia bacterium]MDE7329426.1 MMPL family transporter [Clostridia bacterium]